MERYIRSNISVLIAGGYRGSMYGLKALVSAADPSVDLTVEDALASLPEVVIERRPSVVLLDAEAHLEPIRKVLSQLRDQFAALPIGILSGVLPPADIRVLLALKPNGFLSKNLNADETAASLRLIAAGHRIFGSEVVDHLQHPGAGPLPATLNPEEKELLLHVMTGLDNSVIAARMFMSRSAVKRRLQALLTKLGVSNRTQAAVWAARYGLREQMAELA